MFNLVDTNEQMNRKRGNAQAKSCTPPIIDPLTAR